MQQLVRGGTALSCLTGITTMEAVGMHTVLLKQDLVQAATENHMWHYKTSLGRPACLSLQMVNDMAAHAQLTAEEDLAPQVNQ